MTPKTCPKCGSDKLSISVVNGVEEKYGCRICSAEWYPERIVEKIVEPLAKAKKTLSKALTPKVKA